MSEPQKFNDFVSHIMDVAPMAIVGEEDGMIVIYTNLRETVAGNVVPVDEPNLTGI